MAEQDRVALILAVDEYDHPGLQRLSAPVADADALAETLGRPELGGFSVKVCHNLTSAASAEELEEFLMDRRAGDLALLHFSGHGLKDESGGLYLAAKNTIPHRLASTAIDATLVNLLMRRSRARSIVLFLDCCYGGAFERGMAARAGGNVAVREQFSQAPLGGGRGRVVITASNAVQYAFEGTRLADSNGRVAPSLFTGAVVDGIRSGDADRDADGLVSLGELYEYVFEKVREQSPHQTPSKWAYGLEGELIISKAPRRRLRPAALPDELVQIIRHPYPVARRGAVDELTRLANGADLPVAAAAFQALRAMRDDDSRGISVAAGHAVETIGMSVTPQALSFGALDMGQVSPIMSCELTGPPLVEASEVTAEPAVFTPYFYGRRIEVTVDTGAAGAFGGTLHAKSPIGQVQVPLTVVVRTGHANLRPPELTTHAQNHGPPGYEEADEPPRPGRIADPAVQPPDQPGPDPATTVMDRPDPPGPPTESPSGEELSSREAPTVARPAPIGRASGVAHLPVPRRLGSAAAVVGGVLMGVALFVPWVSGMDGENSIWVDSSAGAVLLLPSIVVTVAALVLARVPGQPLAVGVVLGGAAHGLLFLLEMAAGVSEDDDAFWQSGVLIQVSAVLLTALGAVLLLHSSAEVWQVVNTKQDRWTVAGLLLIGSGLIVALVLLNSFPSVQPWMWAYPIFLSIIAAPFPFWNLPAAQRMVALSVVTTFYGLWVANTLANVAGGSSWVTDSFWWFMILASTAILAGCFLSQRFGESAGGSQPAGTAQENGS